VDISLTGVILAAGPGTRFGHPKALAAFGDENCASLAVRKLHEASIRDILVVTGAGADEVKASLERNRLSPDASLRIVFNEAWQSGIPSSIGHAIGLVSPSAQGALFLPVHYPLVSVETIALLAQLFAQENGASSQIMVPIYEGRLGCPVIVGRGLFGELAAARGDDPIMDTVMAVPARTVGVSVTDPGSVFAIETRDDHMKAMRLMTEEEYETV
jgi:molybdenum cofactor cytidylyltransferase